MTNKADRGTLRRQFKRRLGTLWVLARECFDRAGSPVGCSVGGEFEFPSNAKKMFTSLRKNIPHDTCLATPLEGQYYLNTWLTDILNKLEIVWRCSGSEMFGGYTPHLGIETNH